MNLKVFEYKLVRTCDDVEQNSNQQEYPDQNEHEDGDEPWNV